MRLYLTMRGKERGKLSLPLVKRMIIQTKPLVSNIFMIIKRMISKTLV